MVMYANEFKTKENHKRTEIKKTTATHKSPYSSLQCWFDRFAWTSLACQHPVTGVVDFSFQIIFFNSYACEMKREFDIISHQESSRG